MAYLRSSRASDTSPPTALSNRNMVINGAMQVSQRTTSETGCSGTLYTANDRFEFGGQALGTYTITQDSTGPGFGFVNSYKLDCTTAKASPASSNYNFIRTKFEGQDMQRLEKGNASAKATTLSFWVKAYQAGTYQVNLKDEDNNRIIGATYVIASSATWEKKKITFAGDTSGGMDDDNAFSMSIEWWLASGTDYTSGAVPTAWESKVDADRNAGGGVNLASSTSNYWQITGVQLELGSIATPFEHRSYGDELARCSRYYQRIYNPTIRGTSNASHLQRMGVMLMQEMRAAPSVTFDGTFAWYDGDGGGTFTAYSTGYFDTQSLEFDIASFTGSCKLSASTGTYYSGGRPSITSNIEL